MRPPVFTDMSIRLPARLVMLALLSVTCTAAHAAGQWQCDSLSNGLSKCTGITPPAEPLIPGDSEAAPGVTDTAADPLLVPVPAATAVTAPATAAPAAATTETTTTHQDSAAPVDPPATMAPAATPAAAHLIPQAEPRRQVEFMHSNLSADAPPHRGCTPLATTSLRHA